MAADDSDDNSIKQLQGRLLEVHLYQYTDFDPEGVLTRPTPQAEREAVDKHRKKAAHFQVSRTSFRGTVLLPCWSSDTFDEVRHGLEWRLTKYATSAASSRRAVASGASNAAGFHCVRVLQLCHTMLPQQQQQIYQAVVGSSTVGAGGSVDCIFGSFTMVHIPRDGFGDGEAGSEDACGAGSPHPPTLASPLYWPQNQERMSEAPLPRSEVEDGAVDHLNEKSDTGKKTHSEEQHRMGPPQLVWQICVVGRDQEQSPPLRVPVWDHESLEQVVFQRLTDWQGMTATFLTDPLSGGRLLPCERAIAVASLLPVLHVTGTPPPLSPASVEDHEGNCDAEKTKAMTERWRDLRLQRERSADVVASLPPSPPRSLISESMNSASAASSNSRVGFPSRKRSRSRPFTVGLQSGCSSASLGVPSVISNLFSNVSHNDVMERQLQTVNEADNGWSPSTSSSSSSSGSSISTSPLVMSQPSDAGSTTSIVSSAASSSSAMAASAPPLTSGTSSSGSATASRSDSSASDRSSTSVSRSPPMLVSQPHFTLPTTWDDSSSSSSIRPSVDSGSRSRPPHLQEANREKEVNRETEEDGGISVREGP